MLGDCITSCTLVVFVNYKIIIVNIDMIIITMDMDCCKSSIPYLSMLMVKYMRIVCFMGLKKLFFLVSVTTPHVLSVLCSYELQLTIGFFLFCLEGNVFTYELEKLLL